MVTIGQTLKIHKYCSQLVLVCFFLSSGILVVSCFDLMTRTVGYVCQLVSRSETNSPDVFL